jgi:hypothetical protein
MITRTLELPESVERCIQLACTAYHLTGAEFIRAAIDVALACSADEEPVLARAFELAAV